MKKDIVVKTNEERVEKKKKKELMEKSLKKVKHTNKQTKRQEVDKKCCKNDKLVKKS